MLNRTHTLLRRLRRPQRGPDADPRRWHHDPLAHPALQRMSLEELADLPFDRLDSGSGRFQSGPVTPPG